MKQQQWLIASVLILACGTLRGQVQTSPPPPLKEDAPPPNTHITMPTINPNGPARISGGVMAGMVLTRQAPLYPPEAKAKGISGTVVLHAIIGKDGKIEKLVAITGPDLLRQASLDAVNQWTYKPYLLNGEPTEVDTTITVNFNLNTSSKNDSWQISGKGGGEFPLISSALPEGAVRVPENIEAANIIHKVEPHGPVNCDMCADVSGTVVLLALINKSGEIKSLSALSGPNMLKGSALDAVRQWRYKPYIVDGKAVEVQTTITVRIESPASTR